MFNIEVEIILIKTGRGTFFAYFSIYFGHATFLSETFRYFVQTNRIDKANERLEVLKGCNCEEYGELELIIKTRGTKVY